ncbi:MAG: 50S ribosomal protein L28 [Planctomycetes bacterium]|nr:50S ribosomal protein L28 [Planctomycetota bacterium]
MARECQICGKRSHIGWNVARRGLPKKKGGIGLKTTGHTKRTYLPNLQIIRAYLNGKVARVKICTGCLKANKVLKSS